MNIYLKSQKIIKLIVYFFEIAAMKSHVAIKRWYIFEFPMTEVALDLLEVASASRGRSRTVGRSARRSATTAGAPILLTPLLRL